MSDQYVEYIMKTEGVGVVKDFNEARKERSRINLAAFDPTGWVAIGDHLYSRKVAGRRLQYWPNTRTAHYGGRVMRHVQNIELFIALREREANGPT